MKSGECISGVAVAALLLATAAGEEAADRIRFNRDIRPILADNCFTCHGPDAAARRAELRLDTREGLFAEVFGEQVVVPGQPAASLLFQRVSTDDPADLMPPPATGKRLTEAQLARMQRWIEEGAEWEGHWAYLPLNRPSLPGAVDARWGRHPIDAFIGWRLEREGLTPAPEADPRTLIRRLHLDLLGLPPAPEDVDAFVAEAAPDAWPRWVDRLLGSLHFGERLAVYWLDLVRYADTDGFHADNYRSVWPYRDYVIRAFNENRPFDRFTIEQLAGDLLPEATVETRVASTYNRLGRSTEEGGAQPKEYLAKYAADRVRTLGTAWLAGTTGCAECHDHKYDPYTAEDFYRLAAYFADITEEGVGKPRGTMLPTAAQAGELARLDREIAAAGEVLQQFTPGLREAFEQWQTDTLRLLSDASDDGRVKGLPEAVRTALRVAREERSAEQTTRLERHFLAGTPLLEETRTGLAGLQKARETLVAEIPTTLATVAGPPRVTRVLPRGDWLDESGPVVAPAPPSFLTNGGRGGDRETRLDLARWLVSRENPLTARVFVNRLWRLFHGVGLSKDVTDFGVQGEWPEHPELLDWLAVEFIESGWDVKHMVRLLVTSDTYRRSSRGSGEVHRRDPFNRLYARQSRFRLEAEMIRDGALAASGLLVRAVGGPSVKPLQPAGYWDQLNFPKRTWEADQGEALHRRGLYVLWCRTFLHPSLLSFDACTREESSAERAVSNTPLQALTLLNDPSYVEAARVLGARAVREGGEDLAARIGWLFRRVLSRPPEPVEAEVLGRLYREERGHYAAHPAEAARLVSVGEEPVGAAPVAGELDPIEVAAWTGVARVLLNLDEAVVRN